MLPCGRRHKSVTAVLEAQNSPTKIREGVQKVERTTRVVNELCLLRTRAGLTQSQIAERIGCTQSRILKPYGSVDRDLSLGEILDYVKATGYQTSIGIGKPLTHAQSVKADAARTRRHLTSLADLANKHDELEPEIQSFFGASFFNLQNIPSDCQGAMQRDLGETEFEIFCHKGESGTASSAPAI